MEYKKCTKCGEVKTLDEFYFRKDSNKYRNECKKCHYEVGKLWAKNNTEKTSKSAMKWQKLNPDKVKKYTIKYINKPENKIKIKARRIIYCKNKAERIKECAMNWIKLNPDKVKKVHNKAVAKYAAIPKNKVSHNIATYVRIALKSGKNGHHWEELVGYTLDQLMIYLASKFQEGMSWDNYGRNGWHIDHIIPKSLWEFSSYDDREFKQCWSLCNLQPLWEFDNISKGNKVGI